MDDLYDKSDHISIITDIMRNSLKQEIVISECHNIKSGDGNTLYYVITNDKRSFLIDIVGIKVQDESLIFWLENIDHAGKLCELYYERDYIVITFQRSEDYQGEYLSYVYNYGHYSPSVRFIPKDIYPAYSKRLSAKLKKHPIKLPEELIKVI